MWRMTGNRPPRPLAPRISRAILAVSRAIQTLFFFAMEMCDGGRGSNLSSGLLEHQELALVISVIIHTSFLYELVRRDRAIFELLPLLSHSRARIGSRPWLRQWRPSDA